MQNKETAKTVLVRRQKSPYPFIFITIIVISILSVGFLLLKNRTEYVAYKNVKIGNETFKLEIADTESARTKGLSYRDSLAKNSGMLFDFKANSDWRMWMLAMHFNIDMAWLTKDGKIVHIKSNAEPGSYPEAYHADIPNWYVIEVPAGTFERLGVHEGDTLRL